MKGREYIGRLVGYLATSGLALLGLTREANSGVTITSRPPEYIVRGADKDYEMKVLGNTIDEVGKKITSVRWEALIPGQVTFVNSILPSNDHPSTNLEDFFYNWNMWHPDYNYVDNTIVGGIPGWPFKLEDNLRTVATNDGPSEVNNKTLGIHRFRVPAESPLGRYNFLIGFTKFIATDGTEYTTPTSSGVSRKNDPFEIVDVKHDVNQSDGIGKVNNNDYEMFKDCMSGPSVVLNSGCEWADSDGDNDVDQKDFAPFQRCLSGDDVLATTNTECYIFGPEGAPEPRTATSNESLTKDYSFNAEKQSWEEGGREEKSIGFKLTDILMDFGEVFYNQERQKR